MRTVRLKFFFNSAKWTVVILLLLYAVVTLKRIENKLQATNNTTWKQFGALQYDLVVGNLQSQLVDLERKLNKQHELLEYIHEDTRGY